MNEFDWFATSGVITVTIVLIAILLIWRINKDKMSGFPLSDERTQRIAGRASMHALNAGSFFIVLILLWTIIAREFLSVPNFTEEFYSYILITLLLIQSLSFALISWYLSKKEEQ